MKLFFFIAIFFTLFVSCMKIQSNNPFDSECPKQLFTPTSFQAVQSSDGIELSWSQVTKNITGYKIMRGINNGAPITIGILPKDSTHLLDTTVSMGTTNKYTLLAYAGSNESNIVPVEIPINILVQTTLPTQVTTNSAILNGILKTAPGVSIRTQGFSWKNSNVTLGFIGAGVYNVPLTNLLPNTIYTYRAFAVTNDNLTVQGKEITFTTLPLSLAILNTATPNPITSSFATIGGSITYDGGSPITESGLVYSNSPNPTITNSKIINTTAKNDFLMTISSLSPLTTYYVRTYAINSQGVSYGNQVTFKTTAQTINSGSVSDIDGNVYKTINIGNQVWMAENLKTTKYNNGAIIPNITDSLIWGNLTSGAFCWFNNSISNKSIYGGLYNYYAVNTGNLCPIGWHVPSDLEWESLISFLGGTSIAGGKMKEVGTLNWLAPNVGATNSSGFTGKPDVRRSNLVFSSNYKTSCMWWSSTFVPSNNPNYTTGYTYYLVNSSTSVSKGFGNMKSDGILVRCVGN
jgi:uncharacterized protein (TIGR02145 family)